MLIFVISDKSLNLLYESSSFAVFNKQAWCKLSIVTGIMPNIVKEYKIIPIIVNPGLSITYIPFIPDTSF